MKQQKKLGLDPVFVPERCGIKGAEIWNDIVEKNYGDQLAALKEKVGDVNKPMSLSGEHTTLKNSSL